MKYVFVVAISASSDDYENRVLYQDYFVIENSTKKEAENLAVGKAFAAFKKNNANSYRIDLFKVLNIPNTGELK